MGKNGEHQASCVIEGSIVGSGLGFRALAGCPGKGEFADIH